MILAALLALGALVPAPQGGDNPFVVGVGADAQPQVTADRRSIDCLTALRELAAAVGYNLLVDNQPLENDLRFHRVDLYFEGQAPRMVAQLIAIAAGADVVFDESAAAAGGRPTLHVLRTPDASTESGRQRLRTMAGQWYRSFLRDELRHDPLVAREAVQVRMSLGQLLVDSGDLDGAIAHFTDVYENRPHDFAAAAVLRLADCHLDLARVAGDRQRRAAEFAAAEAWARKVFELLPASPEATPATVALGKAILGQAEAAPTVAERHRHAERCRVDLGARVLRLVDSVEMLDVWLLVGEAYRLLDRADRVHETMLTLRESPNFGDLAPAQFLGYHFLLGCGALGTQRLDLAMRAFEWFLIHAENDPRSAPTYVMLAETYLAQGRFVQARAAAVEARTRFLPLLDDAWRQRALEVWARTALALGEKDLAFLELEQILARGEEPQLAMFVVGEMIADRQWQRAITIARRYSGREGDVGDQARFLELRALYEQASASQQLQDFPARAIVLAPRILAPELRRKVSDMVGDAYAKMGKLEHAADAYRGILR